MKTKIFILLLVFFFSLFSCGEKKKTDKTAAQILSNPEYLAFSYGGYREKSRDDVPSVADLKEDMKILSAMGVKIIRTYNTKLKQTPNLLQAIHELKQENPDFEMYVMLGAWIDCQNAWTDNPNHNAGDEKNNAAEIERAIAYAKKYPGIVKIIAVGNEAMVHWAATYYVQPEIILKWVNYLQEQKTAGELPKDLWITSSDNYASWGGADDSYHLPALTKLLKAVDYVSLHTYPFHETHYEPEFWLTPKDQEELPVKERIQLAMQRSADRAKNQYQSVVDYMKSLGIEKPVHIGETGWATNSKGFYGPNGSKAADEYKEKRYYDLMREWTKRENIACFYFEAFDEQWKDPTDTLGSENHFGLINLKSQVKYALWRLVDKGVFDGLTRNGKPITKTFQGSEKALWEHVFAPPLKSEMPVKKIENTNENRTPGEVVTEDFYLIAFQENLPFGEKSVTYPSAPLKLNPWEGTSTIEMSPDGLVRVAPNSGDWWGCAFELQADDIGENLSEFENAFLNFDIKGQTQTTFQLGFQTGQFSEGNQVNNFVLFSPEGKFSLNAEWKTYKIPLKKFNKGADLSQVTSVLYFRGGASIDNKPFFVKNIYYSKN